MHQVRTIGHHCAVTCAIFAALVVTLFLAHFAAGAIMAIIRAL